ncbi:MAG: ribonuclease HI [Bacteriovoracaceae bacterium]|nr:ribonuclease HI [Bacteriovoracaceae bacterium]
MSKRRFENTLRDMIPFFEGDEDALKAIELLSRKVAKFDSKALVKVEETTSDSMPIPVELIQDPSAFAVYSDGACRGNPGPGAWGAMGQDSSGQMIFEASGVDVPTTNNRMELTGAIEAVQHIRNHLSDLGLTDNTAVHLFSDSKYVVDGVNSWVDGWKRRGWKKADKKPPENVEIWKQIDQIKNAMPNLKWHWVKGHAGHPQNEHCDQLANMALDNSGF